jgi:hypothetical protein
MQRYQNAAQDALGNVIQGMSASVFLRGTQTLASIFSDNGVTPATNPLVTDSLGGFAFYAANGRYDIQLAKTGLPTTNIPDVLLFDPVAGGGPLTVTTLTATVSVVTPLVTSGGTTTIDATGAGFLSIGGTNQYKWDAAKFSPVTDNTLDSGNAALRWAHVFTPIVDSGTSGPLQFRTNNGAEQLRVAHVTSAVNFVQVSGSGSGAGTVDIANGGTDANLDLRFSTKGAGIFNFYSDATTALQFQILRAASSTRNITVAGSNGGNPVLNTTAGGLDVSSATVRFPNIGTTAVAANATLNAVGSNDLLRSTSSMRYKTDIADLADEDLLALEQVRLVRYRSASPSDDPALVHYGMLAEDVARVNPMLVTTTKLHVFESVDLDVPDWVQYERFIPLLIEQGRRDRARIKTLEAAVFKH